MTHEPEQYLENKLVTLLVSMGYKKAEIHNEKQLLSNFKTQLEIHNKVSLTDNEFKQILNYINKGNIYERAKILLDRVPYINQQGETKTIELKEAFNQSNRYERHSYGAGQGLFHFVQVFVIRNGVNTN